MIRIGAALPALPPGLRLFCARDSLLENLPVLILYGPSTTGNTTQNTSRIQAHVFSLAGADSYLRLTIAPTSPLYAAVGHLASDLQGDETYRGLAISLLCYFASLANETKTSLRDMTASRRPDRLAPMMFDEMHAGQLAAMMEEVEEPGPVTKYLSTAVAQQSISWVDMDVLLPAGTMKRALVAGDEEQMQAFDVNGLPLFHYGLYDELIQGLGTSAFLPTSRLRRAPSRATAHAKSQTLSKDAKISLRREMCELVDTESSYRERLSETVNKIAVYFRGLNGVGDVEGLFPDSLDQIFRLSSEFYDEVQSVLDSTEDEAIRDIEGLVLVERDAEVHGKPSTRRDPTGAISFAKVLLAWFPKFLAPYQDYLRASNHFQKIISEGMGNVSSKLSNGIKDIGEQRLRSCLIEPVQRLPRYSLLVDNMVSLLPTSHPSLSSFLKARDMITEICALDTSDSSEESRSSRILNTLVQDWPASSVMQGRLIAAVDVVELDPPFEPSSKGNPGMFLLFKNSLVLLDKLTDGSLSARGLVAEIDRPTGSNQSALSLSDSRTPSLAVSECFELSETQFTESQNGRVIHLTGVPFGHTSVTRTTHFKVFCLQGPYEGKAARFSEDVAKARIESRHRESIRESGKWALRTVAESDNLNIVAALHENGQTEHSSILESSANIVLCIGDAMSGKKAPISTTMAYIATEDFVKCHLQIVASSNKLCKVECTIQSVIPLLLKQLGDAIKQNNQRLIDHQTSYFRCVLNHLPLPEQKGQTKHHAYRPISPIKMLSKVFSGDNSVTKTASKINSGYPSSKVSPSQQPPTPAKEQATGNVYSGAEEPGNKVTVLEANNGTYRNPLTLLEDTFTAYVIALRSRSGNVVGKVLRNRAVADELSINELYNKLLEDPSRIQTAVDFSVGVVFSAFEKFLRVAWRERMGPLIAPLALQNLQSSLDAGRPAVFIQDFKNVVDNMSPQNRRCFAAMVKLLAELLDASGNDGDRGVLIASFAEALVLVGNPQDYITLLDRLVDDYDRLFEDVVEKPGSSGSATGSVATNRSFNAGSFSSNTSSLRKKFGLGNGLSRENSKNESESKVASIWRNLSKNGRAQAESHALGNSQPGSLSKASLVRSRSTDTMPKMLAPFRPGSRDKACTMDIQPTGESGSRPGSSHNTTSMMSTSNNGAPNDPSTIIRKKRRSSLSDLVKVQETAALAPLTPFQPRQLPSTPSPEKGGTLPKTPHTRNPSLTNRFDRSSPPRSGIPRLGPQQRRENSPLKIGSKENSPSPHNSQIKQPKVQGSPGEVSITSYSPRKRSSTSRLNNAPARNAGLSERTWPPNTNIIQITPTVEDTAATPKKLRMQSPQKIRERLKQEQEAASGTELGLQTEINKISEEFSRFKLHRAPPPHPSSSSPIKAEQLPINIDALSARLDTLQQSLQSYITTHTTTTTALRTDLDTYIHHTTTNTNAKIRHLDTLYKEANAENEALYDRFNDDLGKVLGRVKAGEGVVVMKEKMDEAVKEAAALRSERARLRREIVGFRM